MTEAKQQRPFLKRLSPLTLVLGLSALFFIFFLIVSGALFLSQGSGGGARSGSSIFGSGGYVGLIELNGIILDSKKILKNLDDFSDDDRIKSVVLRLNSPGGAVAPSQEIYEAVKKFKKPIIASMGSVAASGAYYIACGTKKIIANPGTITGSIGVIMEFINLEKLYAWAKIQRYALKTGKFKGSGAEYREMTPEEKAIFQSMLDDVLVQFKTAVSTGRKMSMADVTKIADGRVFSGHQAKAEKLVDELGTLEDAINEAGRLGGIKGKPKIVHPEKPHRKIWDLILNDVNHEDDSESSLEKSSNPIVRLFYQIFGNVPEQNGNKTVTEPGIYWLWNAPL